MEFENRAQSMNCIQNSYLEFHNKDVYSSCLADILGENEAFGILKIKTKSVTITSLPTLILFTIDATGSMNERISSNVSKIDVVKQSFKSMMLYLSKTETPIYVRVNTFNDSVDTIVNVTRVTRENVANIISKIDGICCDSITNMGLALEEARQTLEKYQTENPEHNIAHIFMTDGNPTTGENRADKLSEMINENYGNVFIGFGNDHNLMLLRTLSNKKNADYQYINDMESTSLVYGEMLHKYLYPCIRDAYIRVENGLIYDWKNKMWSEQIHEECITGESEKVYHIKKTKDSYIAVDIYGTDVEKQQNTEEHLEQVYEIPYLLTMETGDIVVNDLTNYMFRQKTQELLFDVNLLDSYNEDYRRKKVALKKTIRNCFGQMRSYMRENNLMNDAFMKQLCDDLYITYSTMNSNCGNMFTLSRLTSQGRQQTYSATPRVQLGRDNQFDSQITPATPLLRRRMTGRVFREYDNIEEANDGFTEDDAVTEIDTYSMEDTNKSCYATNSVLETMTQIQNQTN